MTYDPNDRPPLEHTLFVLVSGGSLPSQTTASIRPANRRGPVPPTQPADGLWFESAHAYPPGYWETPPEQRPNVWPRNAQFCVHHEISIGTIDELVEVYRRRLTEACQSIYDCDPNGMRSISPQQQDYLREVRDESRRAHSEPDRLAIIYDFDGRCLATDQYQQRIMAEAVETGVDANGRPTYQFPPAPQPPPALGHVILELPL